ncbi:hypothetical protein [Sphingomonas sp.]|uniref:hypothetical protein n=1 Tax=Sphingomonas sp. TaxID=28214 RepID=UPI003D6D62F8
MASATQSIRRILAVAATNMIIVFALFLPAQPAHAKDSSRSFRTIWMIEGPKPGPETVSIPEKELVLKQRLFPTGLVKLSQAFPGRQEGEVAALPAGAELIQAVVQQGKLYCSTHFQRASGLKGFLRSSGSKWVVLTCLLDTDRDGSFDQAFTGAGLPALPGAIGQLPKKPMPITPLPYEIIDPSAFSERYFVGLRYDGQAKIGTLRRFNVVFGTDGAWDGLTDNIFTKRDSDLPKTLTVMGSSITILGGDGKNVRARVDNGFPIQPFGVVVTAYTYFM